MMNRFSLIFLLLSIGILKGEQLLPDLKKAFVAGKFMSVEEIDPFNKILSYGVDTKFSIHKAELHKYLGEGWIEMEVPKKESSGKKRELELDDVKKDSLVVGEAMFANPTAPQFENVRIFLRSTYSSVFGTKYSVMVAVERSRPKK